MQISCLQEHLAKGLAVTSRAVSSKSPLPILTHVLLDARNSNGGESKVRLAATNLEVGISCWVAAQIEAPGAIGQYSQFRRIALGEFNGQTTPRLRSVLDALSATGATVEVSDNILQVLWTKFVFIASVSALEAGAEMVGAVVNWTPVTE